MTPMKHILIVDDDAFIRRPIQSLLREDGYHTATATDADEGAREIERERPDLIILDVMMPGKDGVTWCAELKGDPTYSRIPIVLLSAHGQEEERERGLAAGAVDFMSKPYSPVELRRRVGEILSRG